MKATIFGPEVSIFSPWPRGAAAQLLRPVLEGRDVLAVMPRGARRFLGVVGRIHGL